MNDLIMIKGERPLWPSSSNVLIIRDKDGLIMIEAGCGGEKFSKRLVSKMRSQNLMPEKVHTVVLSHAHPDHMGGITTFLKISEPMVIISEIDAPSARNNKLLIDSFNVLMGNNYFPELGFKDSGVNLLTLFETVSKCPMATAEPDKTVREGDKLQLGDYLFEVLHTPGHSPGHISLVDQEEKICYAGDVIGEVVAWYSPSSGGAIGYLSSLEKIERFELEKIYPAHGEIITDKKKAINRIRGKILERENYILKELEKSPVHFREMVEKLYPSPNQQFFPGVQILESHLVKLEEEKKITRKNHLISLIK
ncbi:MAG: MBL fold metallo-hydrolase [Candidatus Jordarchaeum sp.]|uniref:MBL fold metallo-hydrolase n=1 Tax=Candidatus Jordarchaeum sp. TaxID=2823881 RepID=UPI00404ABBA6